MKTSALPSALFALILAGTTATIGCSAFHSDARDYAGPNGFSNDVSDLPDPNELASNRNDSAKIRDSLKQYGYGQRMPESAERLWAQANSFFEQKRYHDAQRVYKKYLATPEAQAASADMLALAHYRIGFVERKKMFFSEAAKEFKEAVRYAPQNDEYLFQYAKSSYEANDFRTADSQFVTLLNRNPSYPEAQYYYGLTLLESSNRTNALQPLTATVGELQAYALLTDRYYAKGELQQAAQAEGQLLQIAARLGHEVPELPNKAKKLADSNSQSVATAPSAYAANADAAYYPQPVVPTAPTVATFNQQPQQGYFPVSNQNAPQTNPAFVQNNVPSTEYIPTTEVAATQSTSNVPTTESAQEFASYAPTNVPEQTTIAPDAALTQPSDNMFTNEVQSFAPVMENAPQTSEPQVTVAESNPVSIPESTSATVAEPQEGFAFATSSTPQFLPEAPVENKFVVAQEPVSVPESTSATVAEPQEGFAFATSSTSQFIPEAPVENNFVVAQEPVSTPLATQAAPAIEQSAEPTSAESQTAGFALSATANLLQTLNEAEQAPEQSNIPTTELAQTFAPAPEQTPTTQTPVFAPIPVAENQVFMTPTPEPATPEFVAQIPQQPQPSFNPVGATEQPSATFIQPIALQSDSNAQQAFVPGVPQAQPTYALANGASPLESYPQGVVVPAPQTSFDAVDQNYASQEIPTQPQALNEEDFAFATSGSSAPVAQQTPNAVPAYVAVVPTNTIPTNVLPQTNAIPTNATPYGQTIPGQAPATFPPQTQGRALPAQTSIPASTPGVLPANSLFNMD